MIHASSQRSFPRVSYELYDNQPQCVCSLMEHEVFSNVYCYIVVIIQSHSHSEGKQISVNRSLCQTSSNITVAIALYFDSSLEREITLYFLFFHDTNFFPRKKQYSVVDFLSKGHPVHFTSQKPTIRYVHDLNREALSLELSSCTKKFSLLLPSEWSLVLTKTNSLY